MKTQSRSLTAGLAALLIGLSWSGKASGERLNVVASIPDIGVMVERIGGDRIHLEVLASGREDLHGVPVRPSFIPKLNRAKVLLTLGLDAEHAWLPALAQESRNRNVMEDQKGWIELHHGIEVLDIPRVIGRSEGEQHPEGNPHYNVSPAAGPTMARNVMEALCEADPANADFYRERGRSYVDELEQLAARLKYEGRALAGVAVVSYHPDVSYLALFYGMEVVGSLEPKAGIEPTAGHLAALAEKARAAGVKMILYHQAQSGGLPEEFARKIGAEAVQFANMVGAKREIRSYSDLHEHNLRALLDALGSR